MQLRPGHLLQGGKYRIVEPLGQGGFGITYLAVQPLMQRKVCIKEFFMKDYCLRDATTGGVSAAVATNRILLENLQGKFLMEARIIASLDHPHIIRIYDVFTENGTAYYVMEYIEGKSLNEIVRERGRIPEGEAIGYIRQVGDGLSYLHSRHVNHLDINGKNIMLRSSDGRAVLIDFGLSRRFDENDEETSFVSTSLSEGFAPLEMYQVSGLDSFSPQTDIYELGATLYKLVTGKVPPAATEIAGEGLPEIPKSVSKETRAAIEKAMSFKKKDRPATVAQFLSMLERRKSGRAAVWNRVKSGKSVSLFWKAAVILGSLGALLTGFLLMFNDAVLQAGSIVFIGTAVLAAILLVLFGSVLPENAENVRDRACCMMNALTAPIWFSAFRVFGGKLFPFILMGGLSIFFMAWTLFYDRKRKESSDLSEKCIWWWKLVCAVFAVCIYLAMVVFLVLDKQWSVLFRGLIYGMIVYLLLNVTYAAESLIGRFQVSVPDRTEVGGLILFSALSAALLAFV